MCAQQIKHNLYQQFDAIYIIKLILGMKQNSCPSDQECKINIQDRVQAPKKSNLFFIKSKHAFRQYKNHQYFEDQKQLIDKNFQYRSRQFVQSPAPYGINNAYDYICEEISKNNIRKYNTTQKKFRTLHEKQEESSYRKSETCSKQKRKTHFTLPNLQESKKQLNQKLSSYKLGIKHDTEIKPIQINRRNLTCIAQKSQYSNTFIDKRKKQYFVNLLYVDVEQSVSRLHSFQLKLNIINYIINTFLKAKINYSDLSQQQLFFVIGKILQIYGSQRQHMEYKDLVNLRSTKEIFDFIASLGAKEAEVRQTLRYFFVAKKEVYEYQLNRLRDQIRDRLHFQFENSAGCTGIFMFDIDSGEEITDLYQLIKYKSTKIVVGVQANAWSIYRRFTQELNEKKKMVDKLNNWKSIVSVKNHTQMNFKPITVEKYQNLFEKAQKKRAKINRNGKKCDVSLKNSQFINRQELYKDYNIFE